MSEAGNAGAGAAPIAAGSSEGAAPQGGGQAPALGAQGGKAATSVAEAVKDAGGAAALDLEGADGDRAVTVKIGGEMVTMPLREAMRDVMRSKAAYRKMEEATAAKRESQRVIEMIKQDPGGALKHLGPAAIKSALKTLVSLTMDEASPLEQRRAVEEVFSELLSEQAKSPDERRAESLKEREERVKREEKALEERQKAERVAKLAAANQRRMTRDFKEALGKAGVKLSADSWNRMIDEVKGLRALGYDARDPDTISEAAQLVRESQLEVRKGGVQHLRELGDADAVAEELGEEMLQKLRERDLKRITGQSAAPAPKAQAAPPKAPQRVVYRSAEEALEAIEAARRAGGG